MNKNSRIIIFVLFLFFYSIIWGWNFSFRETYKKDTIDKKTRFFNHLTTPKETRKGFMFTSKSTHLYGKKFFFFPPHEVFIWMKNVYFPLDVFWFSENGEVQTKKKLLSCFEENCPSFSAKNKNTAIVTELPQW